MTSQAPHPLAPNPRGSHRLPGARSPADGAQIETQGLKYLLLITILGAAYLVGRNGLEFMSLSSRLLA